MDGKEHVSSQHGLPPDIYIPLDKKITGIRFIHKKDKASRVVGYQVILKGVFVGSIQLYQSFEVGDYKPVKMCALCWKNFGHLSSDTK